MEKIKSLHIDTEKTWRGGEQQVTYLVRTLKELGHPPVVICKKGSELAKVMQAEGIECHELRMRNEFDLISAVRISNIVNENGIRIVHAHTSHAHSMMALASLFFKHSVKKVVSRRVDFKLKRNFLNKIKYNSADKYIAVSGAIKDVMIDCGIKEGRISVVHSGVDINKFKNAAKKSLLKEFSLSAKDKIIGNIAFLVDHKGQKYLISAFARLQKEMPDTKLIIVGEGELKKPLKEQAKKLGVEKSVIFTGFRSDIGDFLALFDLFVLSSHLEGLGTAILDALIMKTPVVATDAGGIPEIITDRLNGRLVRKQDPNALSNAIKDLLSNPEKAAGYAENGFKHVCENFDYHVTAKKTLEIYKELLSL